MSEPTGYGILFDGTQEERPRATVEVLVKTYRRRGCTFTVTPEESRDVITIDRERYEPSHRYLILYTPPGTATRLGINA